jgi:hypothetical protein
MKTAVEWLMEINIKQNGIITAADYHKAKEIEKQQIIDAVKSTDYIIGATNKESEEFAQQYYNETFKSN